ncbi:diguanylate cyclase [Aliiglaciecola sp. CAU 1673]|uniref:sensor domain-containing diguanylate cyclase n=1 Tax=Aliiglaciecola sp. CAU 1673 TaxID=3032595 RepID=UPI0023DCADA1|nr:sensor domain-containing diguanylate cyclase [Aliiglaciecola sp. CAU 1673]MDF2178999.1 diguanylate cyclase [Aliiglaciecola sp. CAU 1673]
MDNLQKADLEDFHWQMELMGSIEVGIVVLNRQFEVKLWNEFMHNHSGILPSQIRGKSVFEFFPEIDQEWFRQKTDPVFKLKSPAFVIWEQRPFLFRFASYRPVTSATEFMYQNVTLFPLPSLSGEIEHLCVVVYDVTDEVISKQRLAAVNQQLQKISRVDGLTGLYNRRYWEECSAMEYKRCLRSQGKSSLVILDIDHFKKINDTYGHPTGDQVIRTLAKVVKDLIRETDLAGRYGGEEFTLLLPDTDIKAAELVAERIRKAVEETIAEHEGEQIRFTISVGVCEFNASFKDHRAWLEQADKGLYKAKEGGRNRVVVT